MISVKITLLCAALCVVTWCDASTESALHILDKPYTNSNKRISRSPGTFVADEDGQRIIIITHKTPKQSDSNNNSSEGGNYFGSSGLSNYSPVSSSASNSNSNSFSTKLNTPFQPIPNQGHVYPSNNFPGFDNQNQGDINQPNHGNYNPDQGYINQPNNIPGNFNPNPNQGYINSPNFPSNYNPNYNPGYINQPNNIPSYFNQNPNQGYINSPNFPSNYNPGYINQPNNIPRNFNPNPNQGYINSPNFPSNYNTNYNPGYINQPNNIPSNFNPNLNQGYSNSPNFPGNYNPNYNQGYINPPNNFPGIYYPTHYQGYINQPNYFPGYYIPNYYPNYNGFNYQQVSSSGSGYYGHGSYPGAQPFDKPAFEVYPSPNEERIRQNIAQPLVNNNNINTDNKRDKIPGALKIIKLLTELGIPLLKTPDLDTTTLKNVSNPPTGGLDGKDPLNDTNSTGEPKFGDGLIPGEIQEEKMNTDIN